MSGIDRPTHDARVTAAASVRLTTIQNDQVVTVNGTTGVATFGPAISSLSAGQQSAARWSLWLYAQGVEQAARDAARDQLRIGGDYGPV